MKVDDRCEPRRRRNPENRTTYRRFSPRGWGSALGGIASPVGAQVGAQPLLDVLASFGEEPAFGKAHRRRARAYATPASGLLSAALPAIAGVSPCTFLTGLEVLFVLLGLIEVVDRDRLVELDGGDRRAAYNTETWWRCDRGRSLRTSNRRPAKSAAHETDLHAQIHGTPRCPPSVHVEERILHARSNRTGSGRIRCHFRGFHTAPFIDPDLGDQRGFEIGFPGPRPAVAGLEIIVRNALPQVFGGPRPVVAHVIGDARAEWDRLETILIGGTRLCLGTASLEKRRRSLASG